MDKLADTLLRAADALDAIGRRDLADVLDRLLKEAKKAKPRHKVGDQVFLKEDTSLPVTAVKVDPRFGACYEVKLWVMERDLREDMEEKKEDDASDHGRELGPTPRLPAE
jgi:hypothetical protein